MSACCRSAKASTAPTAPKPPTLSTISATTICARAAIRKPKNYYARSAGIYQQLKGVNSPELAFVLNNMGVVYESQGKFKDAEKVRTHVLAVYEQTYGRDHPNVAEAVSKLGSHYHAARPSRRRRGDVQACAMPFRIVPISIRSRPPARSTTSLSCRSISAGLAKPRADLQEPSRSKKRRSARAIRWSPSRCRIWPRCSSRNAAMTKPRALAKRVIAIREKALGPRSSRCRLDAGQSRQCLCGRRALCGWRSALPARACAYRNSRSASDHPKVAFTLHNLGYAAEAQRRYPKAEDFDRRTLAIREASLGKEHLDLGKTLIGLGNALTAQKKFAEAEAVLWARACDLRAQCRSQPSGCGARRQ